MNYTDYLRESAENFNSIACMGMDPVIEKIPAELEGNTENKIADFYIGLLEACEQQGIYPGAIKPNYAFYAQYGFEGMKALQKIIKKAKSMKMPVIFDGKFGDVGKTSKAYAKEVFEFWQADCVTVSPYMGEESLSPFLEYCKKGKGVYVLNRTSNKGANRIQNMLIGKEELYLKISELIIEWGENLEGVGAVVGATSMEELEKISKFYVQSGKSVPLLIPGVGSQGGSAEEVVNALKKTGNELKMHRINSSSGINYAYLKEESKDWKGAAVRALQKLNEEIGNLE